MFGKKQRIAVLLVFILCVTLFLPVYADDHTGEVLYHQDFSLVSSASIAGVRKGTAGSADSVVGVVNNTLEIFSVDDRRTYAILPDTPWTDSHTIEISFRFTEVLAANGYFAFLVTCWGDKPANISAVVFRVNGTIDDFSSPSPAIAEKMKSGALIHATIPVENGVLYTMTLESEGESCVVERSSLLRIGEGQRGFSVRNTSAAVEEVYIISGTGYTEKTGSYAETSYAEDKLPEETGVDSPPTMDFVWAVFFPLMIGSAGMWGNRRK